MTKDVISLSISVLLLFRHYISHKITFGVPSSAGVLCSACGAFIVFLVTILHRDSSKYTNDTHARIQKVLRQFCQRGSNFATFLFFLFLFVCCFYEKIQITL